MTRPPTAGRHDGGIRATAWRSPIVSHVNSTATSAPITPAAIAQPKSPGVSTRTGGKCHTGSRPITRATAATPKPTSAPMSDGINAS